jgi:acyl transferase domain-containing protein/thioesterase domain-containing protein
MSATHFKPTNMNLESSSSLPVWRQQQSTEQIRSSPIEQQLEQVVISGVAGRFPGANTVEQYSQRLFNEVKQTERLSSKQEQEHQQFDAEFFGIPSEVAQNMTRVQKMMVEQIHDSIVDAGVLPMELKNKNTIATTTTGLFIASNLNDEEKRVNGQFFSTVFNLTGPVQIFENEFSSSLIALDAARHAILSGKCDQAIVCGVEVTQGSPIVASVFIQKKDNCTKFYAKLLESQLWQSSQQQKSGSESLKMQKLYNDWSIEPSMITYVENFSQQQQVQGNNAEEIQCLAKVYGSAVHIGSCKTVGSNLKNSTGIDALIKMIIAIQSGVIPASVHQQWSSEMKDAKLVKENTKFFGGLMALTSSGLNGLNVNIVMQPNTDYFMSKMGKQQTYMNVASSAEPRLVTCAARTQFDLELALEQIRQNPTGMTANYAATHHNEQDKVRGFAILNIKNKIEQFQTVESSERPVFYLFNGSINTDLLATYEQMMKVQTFRQSIEQATECLRPYGINLIDIITQKNVNQKVLNLSVAHTAIQVALIDCLRTAGVECNGMIGYSNGELVCAYADESLSFEQTILSAYQIAKTIEESRMPAGAMATVSLTWEQAQKRCPVGVTLACHNAETSVTVTGPIKTVRLFVQELIKENISAKLLNTNEVAYHSQYMTSIASQLKKRLEQIIPQPKIRSNKWLSTSCAQPRWNSELAKYASAEYFVNNVCSHVLLKETLKNVPHNAIFIEIGQQSTMQFFIKNVLPMSYGVSLIQSEQKDQLVNFWTQLGNLYIHGVDMTPANLYESQNKSASQYRQHVDDAQELKSQLEKKYEGLMEMPCKWRQQSCECVSTKSQCKVQKQQGEYKLHQVKSLLNTYTLTGKQEMLLEQIEDLMVKCLNNQTQAQLEQQYTLVLQFENILITKSAEQWKQIQELKECILEQMPQQIRKQYTEGSKIQVAEHKRIMHSYAQEKLAQVKYFLGQENATVQQKRILETLDCSIRMVLTHPIVDLRQLQQQLELVQRLDVSWARQEAQQTRKIQDLKEIINEQIHYIRQTEQLKAVQPEQFKVAKPEQFKHLMSVFPEQYLNIQKINRQYPVEQQEIRQFKQNKNIELSNKYQAKYVVDLSTSEDQSLLGHKIQGKHIYPASGFIYLVWKSFAKMMGVASVEECPIQFTNVKFLHQITLNQNDKIHFNVEINQLTGLFQLIETNTNKIVCNGCVESLNTIVNFKQPIQTSSKIVETVSQREIYQCLKQRGYDLEGEFQAINKTSIDGTYGELVWTGKWIQFLDGMIQMNMLAQKSTEGSCLPTLIKSLRIEPSYIQKQKNVRFQDENNNSSLLNNKWLSEEYQFVVKGNKNVSGAQKFEWFTKVQAVIEQKILLVRTWMRQYETTLTIQQIKMLEELETLFCQFQRSYAHVNIENFNEQDLMEIVSKLQEQSELVASIQQFNPAKQTLNRSSGQQGSIASVRMVEDLKQMVREQLQYQEREQLNRQQTCSEQKKFNVLYRKQLDIMRSLTQGQFRFPVEMNLLEDLEKLIQEQQYRHKTMAPVEYTVQQWMTQLRQQQQMLNEYFVQAQHPEVRSVYTYLVKFCKEQLQQEMDFQTESKQMHGFVHQKLTMNFNLVQKLIALLNGQEQGQEESPLKRMYLEKLEQLIQEMYDQTMLTQAIQESMQEAYQTRCVQLKESMTVLERMNNITNGNIMGNTTGIHYEARQMQLVIDELRNEADRLSNFYVQKEQLNKETLPVYYNAQTRSVYTRGIEINGLYVAPCVTGASPLIVKQQKYQTEKKFTDLFTEEQKNKKNELIEMDLLGLIEAMHSLESLRETAESLRDTAQSLRMEQQQPIQVSAKFTTKVSFSPLQAYISSTLDEAERQLIEETMASMTTTTTNNNLVNQNKKFNYLMPQKCIEALNEVDIYAEMTPVVIVHPIEGHTNTLRNLAKNIRSPVFGIQYTREALKCETVEELAKFYWTQIQKQFGVNTQVHLCGHAFGAIIALEMATNKPTRCTSLTVLDDNMTNISYDMYREAREEMEADALMKFALQYYQTMNKVQFFQQLTQFKTTEQRIRFIVKELMTRSQFQFEATDLEFAARAYITKYVMQCMYTPEMRLRLPTVYFVKVGGQRQQQTSTYLQRLVEQCFAGKLETELVDCDARSFLEGNNGYQVATIINENLLRHF